MIIIQIVLLIIGIIFFINAYHIKNIKEIQIKQTEDKIASLSQEYYQQKSHKQQIENQIIYQQQKYNDLLSKSHDYDKLIQEKGLYLQDFYDKLKNQYELGYINYVKNLNSAYEQQEQKFCVRREQLNKSLAQIQEELTAAAAAKRQEEEKSKNLDFYRIQISEKQKRDIQLLDTWKSQLFDPSFVSKVIWSSCIIKPTGDLCNRLTQGKTACGIYKITSLISSKCYIGQSVDIASRFKQHIKCGLGIDAPATNKLYNLMQQEKVYNFTFEILEKCSKDKLNERERFWIQTFQSDKFGLNGTGGNKK